MRTRQLGANAHPAARSLPDTCEEEDANIMILLIMMVIALFQIVVEAIQCPRVCHGQQKMKSMKVSHLC